MKQEYVFSSFYEVLKALDLGYRVFIKNSRRSQFHYEIISSVLCAVENDNITTCPTIGSDIVGLYYVKDITEADLERIKK